MENKLVEIGLPIVNKDPDINELQIAKSTLPYVDLRPLDTESISGLNDSLLLYKLKPATDKDAPPKIRIYIDHNGPISETYSNNLTESFLSSILKTSNRLGQITQILGGKDIAQLGGDILNLIPGLGPAITGMASGMFGMLPQSIQNAITSSLRGDRFELPKLWGDSQVIKNYSISFQLVCNNPNDDKEYKERIVDPIMYLLKYTLPRVNAPNSVVYKWPYFVEADAGALFWVPEGMITDLTFDKAPDPGTLSIVSNRPSIVSVRMTISSIRNAMPQEWNGNTTILPISLNKYLEHLEKKEQRKTEISTKPMSSKTKVAGTQRVPSKQISQIDKRVYDTLKATV